jgi:hypothetical protein
MRLTRFTHCFCLLLAGLVVFSLPTFAQNNEPNDQLKLYPRDPPGEPTRHGMNAWPRTLVRVYDDK